MRDITASLEGYPPAGPVKWIVTAPDGRTHSPECQSWFSARHLGAAALGVDESLVIVTRYDGPTVPDVTPKAHGAVEIRERHGRVA